MDSQSNKLIQSIFDHGPVPVRRLMVRQFGGGDPATPDALLPLAVRDRDLSVRLAALEVIAAHRRKQDLDLLSLALSDPHAAARAASAHALGQYRSLQAGTLLQRMLKDPHPEVRATAALALGQVPTLQFSTALENTLADPDGQVRAAAAMALGKVGRPEARVSVQAMAARDSDHQNRQIARQALEAIQMRAASRADKRHQAGVDLLRVLVDPQRSWEARQRAKASLIRIGDEALIPELDKALKDSRDDQVRVDIVEVLAQLPACDQIQTTLLAYLHQVPPVRRRAIVALGEIGDEGAIYYLNNAAREGDQPGQLLSLEDSQFAREAVQKIRRRHEQALQRRK